MSFFDPQNPGIGGPKELTDAEVLTVANLTALGDPHANVILGWDSTDDTYAYFVIGSGLSYNHSTHTLTASSTGAVTSITSADGSITPTGTSTVDLSVVKSPKLSTARTIAGVSFDGTTNIAIPASGLSNGVTGSGSIVLATSPSLTGATFDTTTIGVTQTAGDSSTKLATTAFVANAILGQDFKEAAKYATTGALPSIVYNNGSSGVGATLTGAAFGAISIDSSTPSVGDRILVKNQVSTFQNGIYVVTIVGTVGTVFVLTRSTDFNQGTEIDTGDSVFVSSGSTLSTTTWAYNGIDNPTMGTTAITFAQTAGQGSFTSGNGIAITGVSIAIDTSITVDKTTSQALTNKTISGLTVSTTTGTFTLTNGKTLAVSNSLTLAGTDGTTMTFPSTPATIARTDAGNTFTGASTGTSWNMTTLIITTSIKPTSDNTVAIGDTTHGYTGLFMSTGSTINWNNGNTVLTQSSATLTVSTGTLKVTSPTNTTTSVVTVDATQTLTTKRITRRVNTTTSSGTPAINTDTTDLFTITALAVAITSFTTNLSGTPTDGEFLQIAITDNGTARALAFGASFEASTVALPTTTVISTRLDIGFVWNTVTTKWRCIAVA